MKVLKIDGFEDLIVITKIFKINNSISGYLNINSIIKELFG